MVVTIVTLRATLQKKKTSSQETFWLEYTAQNNFSSMAFSVAIKTPAFVAKLTSVHKYANQEQGPHGMNIV